MQVRVASLFMISLLAVASAVGCQGVDTGEQGATSSPTPNGADDDDDDDDGSTPEGTPTNNPEPTPTQPVGGGGNGNEVELNDDHDTATPLGTSTTFSGACGDLDFSDVFSLSVAAGKTVSASITWAESPDDDLDLYVSSYDYSIDEGDEAVPPGDSPAQASATFPTAQTAFVEVYCYYAYYPDTTYTGTVTVQ